MFSGFRRASHRRKREKKDKKEQEEGSCTFCREAKAKQKITAKTAKERPSGTLPYSALAFRPENRCPCKPMRTQDVGAYRLGS